MQGFEKFLGVAGAVAALLAIGAAFETFTNFGLIAKLSVAGMAGLGLSLFAASALADWTKPTPEMPGYGRDDDPLPRRRVVVSIAALFLIAGLAVGLSFFLVAQFATRFEESIASDKSTAVLTSTLS